MEMALPFCVPNFVSSPSHCQLASSGRCSSSSSSSLWPASFACHLPSPVLQTTCSSSAVGSLGRSGCVIRKDWGPQSRPKDIVSIARSAQDDEVTTQEDPTAAPPSPPPPAFDRKAAAKAETEKGQTTAIITGVISVLLGVGYLVLLQVLDTRGVNLIPPPPEAFDP